MTALAVLFLLSLASADAPVAPDEVPSAPRLPRGTLDAPRGPGVFTSDLGGSVALHVVEPKPFADAGRHELVIYPVVPQINGSSSQHVGTALGYTYHLQENFGLRLLPIFNWSTANSAFNRELNNAVQQEATAASSLLLRWGATAGVEVSPLFGKFAFHDRWLVRWQLVLGGGAGIASTRHELKPGGTSGPPTYGDTGYRFLASVGAGFRVQVGSRFTIRLELQDLLHTAHVTRVNGCSAGDLQTLITRNEAGQPLSGAGVGSGCDVGAFSGREGNYDRVNDLTNARALVIQNSSDLLNNVGVYAGFGVEL